MTEPGKEEGKVFQVRWDAADWKRIEDTAAHMAREQHLEVTPTDVIRSAVRRLCEDKLGPTPAHAAND